MEDTDITCSVCQKPFPFSAAEQAYYAQRGFQFPKRCRACRQARRRGGTSRRLPFVQKRDHVPRKSFAASCAECDTDVQLVFAPGDREIVCPACFGKRHPV